MIENVKFFSTLSSDNKSKLLTILVSIATEGEIIQ